MVGAVIADLCCSLVKTFLMQLWCISSVLFFVHVLGAVRYASTSEQHKSAITDHVTKGNHVIKDWDKVRILDMDANLFSRRIQ